MTPPSDEVRPEPDEKEIINFLVDAGRGFNKALLKVHFKDGDRCGMRTCRAEWPCLERRCASKALRVLRDRARRESRKNEAAAAQREHTEAGGKKKRPRTRSNTDPPAEDTDVSDRALLYAVHAVRPDEICATDVIWTAWRQAMDWAKELSTDPGVLAGAVTRYVADTPGLRTPVALFVKGTSQKVPHRSDDRQVSPGGWITTHRSLWKRNNGTTYKVDTE